MTSSVGGSNFSSLCSLNEDIELTFYWCVFEGKCAQAAEHFKRLSIAKKSEILWKAADTLNWAVLPFCLHQETTDPWSKLREILRNDKRETLLHVIISKISDEHENLREINKAVEAVTATKSPSTCRMINARDSDAKTAIQVACGLLASKTLNEQHVKLFNLLTDAGAEVKFVFQDGAKPLLVDGENFYAPECLVVYEELLHWYIRRKKTNRLNKLFNRFSFKEKVLIVWNAAKTLNWMILEFCLRSQPELNKILNEDGETLLHVIISNETICDESKRLEEINKAVEAVTKNSPMSRIINARDEDQKTALHIACQLNVKRNEMFNVQYVQLLNLLIDAGADVNMKFKDGITPLHLAHESQWAMECLVNNGADVNITDRYRRTAFIWALRNPHFPPARRIPVSTFHQFGYNFTRKDFMGNAPVHYAINKTRCSRSLQDVIHLVEQLVRVGSDVNAQNRRLQTPFFMIIHKTELIELAQCLLNNGAKVDLCDADGYTVVSLAAMMSKIEYLKKLIPKLSHNFVTPTGETVQDLAMYYINQEEIDAELRSSLRKLNDKARIVTKRTYMKPFSVWGYVQKLFSYREMVSLYIVDTFYR